MRVSREQAAENRQRIIDTAARLFRERGFDGIGVADLMAGAGLTHGGFYGHFASKEELLAEAAARALEKSQHDWDRLIDQDPAAPLEAVVRGYLSPLHRDHPGHGCALAALGPDMARQPGVRAAVQAGFLALADKLAGLLPGRSKAIRRRRALAAYSTMVGALLLSRAVQDEALSREILEAAAASVPGMPAQDAA